MSKNIRVQPHLIKKIPWISYLSIFLVWMALVGMLFGIAPRLLASSLYFVPFIFVFIGVFQYHLNILGHDGLHCLLSNNVKKNDFICRYLLHGPMLAPFSLLKKNHLNHHRNLGSEHDPDQGYYDIQRFNRPASFKLWLYGSFALGNTVAVVLKLMKTLAVQNATETSKISNQSAKEVIKDLVSIALCQLVILSSFFVCFGRYFILIYLPIWFLPIFTIVFGLSTTRSCIEHAELASLKNPTRLNTFRPGWLERLFLSPFNMNFHAEHHLHVYVPWYHLRQLGEFYSKEYPQHFAHYRSYGERMGPLARSRSRPQSKESAWDFT